MLPIEPLRYATNGCQAGKMQEYSRARSRTNRKQGDATALLAVSKAISLSMAGCKTCSRLLRAHHLEERDPLPSNGRS